MSSVVPLCAIAALVGFVSAHGCSAADGFNLPLIVGTSVSSSAQQPFTRLLSSRMSGFQEPEELVVRDRNALGIAWRTAQTAVPDAPVPAVDLSRTMVIVLALGPRGNGGYAIHFDSMAVEAGMAIVRYTVNTPGLDCITTAELTSPVDVVLVPRVDGQVRFDLTTLLQKCGVH